MQQKTFYKMILEVNLYPEKMKQCLSDKRLTFIEKKILESYILIRNNKNAEATELLHGLSKSEFPFVEALKSLVLGISFINQSEYAKAEECILKTLPDFKKLESHYCLFLGYFNLCFIYLNSGKLSKVYDCIQAMEKIPQEAEIQLIRLLRCKFNYYLDTEDLSSAEKILQQIEPLKIKMGENDSISHLTSEFMYQVQREDFSKCQDVLNEMKKFRKFHLSANYKYMKKLLDHLVKGAPVYAYAEEFESVPALFQLIKLIQLLEEGKSDEALIYWNILRSSAPQIYKEEFNYQGPKSLFSLCLQKHQKQLASTTQFHFHPEATKYDKFLTILKESKGPVSAGLIFELIWEKSSETKEDLLKVSRLAYRAKTEEGMDISFRKGTYELKSQNPSKKKAS